jgi:hypothetical protein
VAYFSGVFPARGNQLARVVEKSSTHVVRSNSNTCEINDRPDSFEITWTLKNAFESVKFKMQILQTTSNKKVLK